ncbi:MAG: PucR family transcriptional regulator, partial [Dermatophilaceae bacterium]
MPLTSSAASGTFRGLPVVDLVGTLGGGLLTVGVSAAGPEVDDLTLAEPGSGVYGQSGDLLLGVGVDTPEAAIALLTAAVSVGSGGVVLRRATARRREVRAAARRAPMTLLELADHASWAHIVWLLRSVLDQAATGTATSTDGPAHDELFALADACAALVDAPVTIEDTQSRVLAHSTRQDVADPVRLSTIVGRKVPDAVLASLRGRGVFRRLARSSDPFHVPADGDLKGRLVIPVRAGTEWLGSIWAVVDEPPDTEIIRSLTQSASVVALHLLR